MFSFLVGEKGNVRT